MTSPLQSGQCGRIRRPTRSRARTLPRRRPRRRSARTPQANRAKRGKRPGAHGGLPGCSRGCAGCPRALEPRSFSHISFPHRASTAGQVYAGCGGGFVLGRRPRDAARGAASVCCASSARVRCRPGPRSRRFQTEQDACRHRRASGTPRRHYGDQEIADWVRDARRLATLEHPNVGACSRRGHSRRRGARSSATTSTACAGRSSARPRHARRSRSRCASWCDVLSGLGAVHNLRDAKREPLKLVHGELTPECVIVGLDGVARIVSSCRVRSATPGADAPAARTSRPEVLLADESAEARADVYSVGVMLWEALSGRPLFPNMQPSAIVTHAAQRTRRARRPVPDGCAWAAPLAGRRHARAGRRSRRSALRPPHAMAAEIRRIARPEARAAGARRRARAGRVRRSHPGAPRGAGAGRGGGTTR